jgi:hypothetical protein
LKQIIVLMGVFGLDQVIDRMTAVPADAGVAIRAWMGLFQNRS